MTVGEFVPSGIVAYGPAVTRTDANPVLGALSNVITVLAPVAFLSGMCAHAFSIACESARIEAPASDPAVNVNVSVATVGSAPFVLVGHQA